MDTTCEPHLHRCGDADAYRHKHCDTDAYSYGNPHQYGGDADGGKPDGNPHRHAGADVDAHRHVGRYRHERIDGDQYAPPIAHRNRNGDANGHLHAAPEPYRDRDRGADRHADRESQCHAADRHRYESDRDDNGGTDGHADEHGCGTADPVLHRDAHGDQRSGGYCYANRQPGRIAHANTDRRAAGVTDIDRPDHVDRDAHAQRHATHRDTHAPDASNGNGNRNGASVQPDADAERNRHPECDVHSNRNVRDRSADRDSSRDANAVIDSDRWSERDGCARHGHAQLLSSAHKHGDSGADANPYADVASAVTDGFADPDGFADSAAIGVDRHRHQQHAG